MGPAENLEHVAGAAVAVYREVRDSVAGADSATSVSDSFIGTVTTAANGPFTLTNVDRGYFRLKVTPPAGSPNRPGAAGTESFADSTITAPVWLYSKQGTLIASPDSAGGWAIRPLNIAIASMVATGSLVMSTPLTGRE